VAQVIAYVFSLEAASPMNPPRPRPTVKVPSNMEFSPEGLRASAEKAAA
jgi:flagellar biosynthetic protein FlhB